MKTKRKVVYKKMGTFVEKPFISYDGGSADGGAPAEVMVVRGIGRVSQIESSQSNMSVALVIEADNLKYPVRGYVSPNDPVLKVAEEAKKDNKIVRFRMEISRKPHVDRAASIASLRQDEKTGKISNEKAMENTRKLIIGMSLNDDGSMILSPQHLTNPADDVKYVSLSSAIPADSASAKKPDAPVTNNVLSVGGTDGARAINSGTGFIENRPWLYLNYDNHINPGSYAVSGMTGLYFAITDFLNEKLEAAGDVETINSNKKLARILAEDFMKMADAMQVRIYGGKEKGALKAPVRTFTSHAVARSIILDLFKANDSELGEYLADDEEARHNAEKALIQEAQEVWEWAIQNSEKAVPPTTQNNNSTDNNNDEQAE